tara:strand:- start:75 stop:254 length:180 start_codon:yes stop_codon:yes gene_type:complete
MDFSVNIVEDAADKLTETEEAVFVKLTAVLPLTDTLTVLPDVVLTDTLITFQMLRLCLR